MAEAKFFTAAQMKRLETIGAVPHFYTAVNLQYKNNTSAKLDTEVADIYERASGDVVSRNWACGHCSFELYRKAGNLYYASKGKEEEKPGKDAAGVSTEKKRSEKKKS